ncbi:MAG: 2-oxoacid:acceptor oxidoreductase family protein [Deltaproteobacteria bacterium]|nr:2-oxoacid:acceptor oxidoreductase family protein [Deltaproteobacteria bacterium]MBW1948956.1 2-oxoacid:acceptor oxidoreductase family protein [Deltaproteobacteria bacterium]MBW2007125.1 2-oxoacid:acceptor oxidoreductase family protein [Deltaproteobacteria bacterium]MBW2348304.1 2-oxoacid:acceptor oxidoreductase family protein [Deltaproteobacteria bacterium]RLB36548.1 MAG: pyruvate ferredoxin oxidoreductase [Deltaproteobacteria bacterium]
MHEIRFHGRGGQGTVVASIILAKTFFETGYQVQTFPLFGVERRGAPVEAYLRLAEEKILVRSNIYEPDYVIVQDPKLISLVDVTRGLKPGGWILLNTPGPPTDQGPFEGFRLAWVNATGIAVELGLGTRTFPMVNTAMTGAFLRLTEMAPLDTLLEIITREIQAKPEQNRKAAARANKEVQLLGPVP